MENKYSLKPKGLMMILLSLFLMALASSFISGVAGMAGGILLLVGLLLFFPLPVLVPIHGVAQFMSNSSRAFLLRTHIQVRLFLPFLLGCPVGAWLAYIFLNEIHLGSYPLLLIAGLLLYVALKPEKMPELLLPPWGFTILGFIAAFMGCLMGATGPLLAPFYLRSDLSKEEIVATKAASQIFIHLMKIPVFGALAFPYLDYWQEISILIIGVLVGTRIGTFTLTRINRDIFIKVLKVLMILVAIRIIFKAS